MDRHDDIRVDLPAYLAHDLDAGRAGEIRTHLRDCDSCRREAEELREVAALVASAPLEHRPPDHLEDRVMAFVELDRDAGDVAPLTREARRSSPAWALAGAAVAACLVFLAVYAVSWHQRAAEAERNLQAWEDVYGPYGHPGRPLALTGAGVGEGDATVRFIHHSGDNYGISLKTPGLAPTPPGHKYEVWLSDGTGWSPAGSFAIAGDADRTFYFHLGEDPADYETMWITLEPDDGDPAPSDRTIAKADLRP